MSGSRRLKRESQYAKRIIESANERAKARAYEARADGWPLCPNCHNDELYSLLSCKDPSGVPRAPTLAEFLEDDDFCCYACSWCGSLKQRRPT
jgi:hypothetical protein